MITLQPYKGPSTRYQCPQCRDRQKTFSRYIDTDTGLQLADHVGKCARLVKCGYHYGPKQFFAEQGLSGTKCHAERQSKRVVPKQNFLSQRGPSTAAQADTSNNPQPISFITSPAFEQSLQQHKPIQAIAAQNNFVQYLYNTFGESRTQQAVTRYLIGTSNHRFTNRDYPGYTSPPGATIFWQGDADQRVRTGKIMLYDAHTGKRVKQPFNHITWAHTLLREPEYNLQQCLFGEHLLYITPHTTTIAIVESEKTAIIASMHMPQFVWLAAGSLSNLTAQRCAVLKGRPVMLFPDLGCYDAWCKKAEQLSHITTMTVSDLLEHNAADADRLNGLDIADYLARARHCEERRK